MSFKTHIQNICQITERGDVSQNLHRNKGTLKTHTRSLRLQEKSHIQAVNVQVIDQLQNHLHILTGSAKSLVYIGAQRTVIPVIKQLHIESLGLLHGNIVPYHLVVVKVQDPVLNLMSVNMNQVATNIASILHMCIAVDILEQKTQILILFAVIRV